jgi:hypothetical protein
MMRPGPQLRPQLLSFRQHYEKIKNFSYLMHAAPASANEISRLLAASGFALLAETEGKNG